MTENQGHNPQFAPYTGAARRKVNTDREDFRREEQRLNKQAGVKPKPKPSYYERQLRRFGFLDGQ